MLSLDWDHLDGVYYYSRTFSDAPIAQDFPADPEFTSVGPCGIVSTASANTLAISFNNNNIAIPCNYIHSFRVLPTGQIVILTQTGVYRLYDDPYSGFNEHTLFTNGVQTATLTDTGIAAVSLTGDLLFAKYGNSPIHLGQLPNALYLALSISHTNTTVYAVTTTGISTFHSNTRQDYPFELPPLRIELSPNDKLLALLFADTLHIAPVATPTSPLVAHKLLLDSTQMKWCGNDLVALTNDTGLDLYGPVSNIHYDFPAPQPLIRTETDGLLLVTPNAKAQYISRVSPSTERIFALGSTAPAATLYDASLADLKATHLLALVTDMSTAVSDCLVAATDAFDVDLQKSLLRAARVGMDYDNGIDRSEFVRVCDKLRIVNSLRVDSWLLKFGETDIDLIVPLLTNFRKHYLAIRVCDILNIPDYTVLNHWAACRIKSDLPDDDLGLFEKLANKRGVQWLQLANVAHVEGRHGLVNSLLRHSSDTLGKAQMLASIGDHPAMITAVDKDATVDPIIFSLLNLQGSQVQFFKSINPTKNVVGVYKETYSSLTGDIQQFMFQDDDSLGSIALNPAMSQYAKPKVDINSVTDLISADFQRAVHEYSKVLGDDLFTRLAIRILGNNPSRYDELHTYATQSSHEGSAYLTWFLKKGDRAQATRYLPLCTKYTGVERVKVLLLCGLVDDALSEAKRGSHTDLVTAIEATV